MPESLLAALFFCCLFLVSFPLHQAYEAAKNLWAKSFNTFADRGI